MKSLLNLAFFPLVAVAISFFSSAPAALAYDPLKIEKPVSGGTEFTVKDEKRGRDIPLLVYLPGAKTASPVVIFSHGLGGSRNGSAYLGEHWAGRGYVAVFVQHAGSDTSVWKGKGAAEIMPAMKAAASPKNFSERVQDIPAVLDQLEKWNTTEGHALAGRLDMKKVGMSGHSFGAVTTQAVSGQSYPLVGQRFTDSRILAALPMSPSSPSGAGGRRDPKESFGKVKIPWLLMTGTKDVAAVGPTSVESRLAVYPALPEGGKYELVLDGGEHGAFTDRALPGEKNQRNPNHHKVILALSTAFWDACLRNDSDAKKWLDGDGPRGILEKADRWQRK